MSQQLFIACRIIQYGVPGQKTDYMASKFPICSKPENEERTWRISLWSLLRVMQEVVYINSLHILLPITQSHGFMGGWEKLVLVVCSQRRGKRFGEQLSIFSIILKLNYIGHHRDCFYRNYKQKSISLETFIVFIVLRGFTDLHINNTLLAEAVVTIRRVQFKGQIKANIFIYTNVRSKHKDFLSESNSRELEKLVMEHRKAIN